MTKTGPTNAKITGTHNSPDTVLGVQVLIVVNSCTNLALLFPFVFVFLHVFGPVFWQLVPPILILCFHFVLNLGPPCHSHPH